MKESTSAAIAAVSCILFGIIVFYLNWRAAGH
jgi:hypothetical protein